MPRTATNGPLELLGLSLIGALAVAVAFVVSFRLSLPASDGAAGQAPFEDPLVLPIMLIGVGLSSLVVAPMALWKLRRVQLGRSFTFCLLWALGVTVAATLIGSSVGLGMLGVPAGLAATLWAMSTCRERFCVR